MRTTQHDIHPAIRWGCVVSVRIIIGDCRELRELPDASVNCCVTSPPYFGLRDYGVEGQMGLEPTPDEFVAGMVEVFREVRRVLRDDGVLFLNIGDSYVSQGGQRTYGSFDGATGRGCAPAQRVGACGKRGKAPEGSLARDCFCQSLCDACRAAYRIGKSHSGQQHAPTLSASSSASTPEHTESPCDRLPTSGSVLQRDRSLDATPDLPPIADHGCEPLPDAPVSTALASVQRPNRHSLDARILRAPCRWLVPAAGHHLVKAEPDARERARPLHQGA
jgi:hypothetical protein